MAAKLGELGTSGLQTQDDVNKACCSQLFNGAATSTFVPRPGHEQLLALLQ